MARNPKLDLAKRQTVGIYRKASPNASINAGMPLYSGGDYRVPEGAKAVYVQPRALPVDVAGHTVTICEPYRNSKGNRVQLNTHAKRGQATPRSRNHMNSFGFRSKQQDVSVVVWAPAGIQTLIPRVR